MLRSRIASPAAGVLFAVLLWSGNFVVGRALRHELPPVAINFWRWTIAAAILLPFAWDELRRQAPLLARHWKLLAALALTGIASFQTLVYVALSETTTVNTLLMLSLAPLSIAFASWALHDERLSKPQLFGAALSLWGAVTLITNGRWESIARLSLDRGELWMLLAVVLWTCYSLLLRRIPPALPPLAVLSATSAIGVLLMLPVYLGLHSAGALQAMDHSGWAGLLYIALFASVPPFFLWNRGVARIGPSRAGAFLNLMPVFGALLAFVFLGEAVRSYQLIGGGLILSGIAAMNRMRPIRAS